LIHLGIDFGTANTKVSRLEYSGIPSVVAIGRGGYSQQMMPSTCWINHSGNIEVGESALARPDRLRYIKRYWQQRREDQLEPLWHDGKRTIGGRVYSCEQIIESVLSEAITRAMEGTSAAEKAEGYTANIVCPVDLDRVKRQSLVQMLLRQGAKSATLSNVIDEPLAAAVLYCRIEEHPPVQRDILVFDAGAGTVDVAIVRYCESDGRRSATVLAEAGRCVAGADLDRVMQKVVLGKIQQDQADFSDASLFRLYNTDPAVGRIAFEDDCERMKILLGTYPTVSSTPRVGASNLTSAPVNVTREEYCFAASKELFQLQDSVTSAMRMAKTVVENFDGVQLAIFVGGTSSLPFVRDNIAACVPGAIMLNHEYLDVMLATVRGTGFLKDFEDLVLLRPPYETRLRITLEDGSTTTLVVNEAYQSFNRQMFFNTSVPSIRIVSDTFESRIRKITVLFVSPLGEYIEVSERTLDPDAFRGCSQIEAEINIKAYLSIRSGNISRHVRAPYFTQVGLREPEPFRMSDLNAPDVYPDDN